MEPYKLQLSCTPGVLDPSFVCTSTCDSVLCGLNQVRILTADSTLRIDSDVFLMYGSIKEHRRALTNGDPCVSALAQHAINHHHEIAWEDAIVVDADPHMYRHRTLEAWHIRQEPNPTNRDRRLLPPVYDSLIGTHPPPDTH